MLEAGIQGFFNAYKILLFWIPAGPPVLDELVQGDGLVQGYEHSGMTT